MTEGFDQARPTRVVGEVPAADALLEGLPDAIVVTDLHGRILQVNREFERGSGWGRAEVLGKTRLEIGLVTQQDDQRIKAEVLPELTKGRPVRNFAVTQRRKGGRSMPALMSWALQRDARGVPNGIISLVRDINDLRPEENQFQHLNQVLRAARNVNQLIAQERDTRRLLARTCDLLAETRGYRWAWIALLDEFQQVELVVGAGEGEAFRYLLERVGHGQLPFCCHRALSTPGVIAFRHDVTTCTVCPHQGHPVLDEGLVIRLENSERIFGILCVAAPVSFNANPDELALLSEVAQDLSYGLFNLRVEEDRLRLLRELTESTEKFRTLFECAPDGYYMSDLGGTFLDGNRMAEQLTGFSRDELIGKNMLEVGLITMDQTPQAFALLQKNMLGQATGPDEFRLTRKDGVTIPVDIRTFPINLQGRDLVLGIARDITDRKRFEEDLLWSNQQLKNTTAQLIHTEKLTALGELAAGVAHELNQPLNAIKIICQSILRYQVTEAQAPLQADLKDILGQVDSMAQIIDHMRIFSWRAEDVVRKEIDLNAPIEDALRFLRQQLAHQGIQLQLELAADLPKILADPVQLEQVFMNLLSNARGALEEGPKGGKRIALRTWRDELTTPPGGPCVVAEVRDNGAGIPEHLINKIFLPFFTTKQPGKGTGLGLSIANKIVEGLGGKIEVESRPGEETIFRLILPVCDGN